MLPPTIRNVALTLAIRYIATCHKKGRLHVSVYLDCVHATYECENRLTPGSPLNAHDAPGRAIAEKYGISRGQVSRIVTHMEPVVRNVARGYARRLMAGEDFESIRREIDSRAAAIAVAVARKTRSKTLDQTSNAKRDKKA